MHIQMYNKDGDSVLVSNKQVRQKLIEGWSFKKKPLVVEKKTPHKRVVRSSAILTPTKQFSLQGPEDVNEEKNDVV